LTSDHSKVRKEKGSQPSVTGDEKGSISFSSIKRKRKGGKEEVKYSYCIVTLSEKNKGVTIQSSVGAEEREREKEEKEGFYPSDKVGLGQETS